MRMDIEILWNYSLVFNDVEQRTLKGKNTDT